MGCSIFVGACIGNGNMVEGFKRFLDNYIVNALANDSHQMVILFTFFLSGVVGMLDKSGGIHGVTNVLLKYARSRRLAQFSAVIFGCCLFFDDYASSLMVGFSMQPLFDPLLISREKLAFITDAVAAP